jgi:hypothetical protein
MGVPIPPLEEIRHTTGDLLPADQHADQRSPVSTSHLFLH